MSLTELLVSSTSSTPLWYSLDQCLPPLCKWTTISPGAPARNLGTSVGSSFPHHCVLNLPTSLFLLKPPSQHCHSVSIGLPVFTLALLLFKFCTAVTEWLFWNVYIPGHFQRLPIALGIKPKLFSMACKILLSWPLLPSLPSLTHTLSSFLLLSSHTGLFLVFK